MITRVNKISKHRVFESFSWPSDLPDFGRFNLIYGWNGSGKTTLSNLFRYLEKKESISEGTVDFHIDGQACSGSSLSTRSLPRIRVFNQDYREDSVFATTRQLKPIFFLGKDSVEKQKEIERLSKARSDGQTRLEGKLTAKGKTSKGLDEFCIREAKAIKELLSSSGDNKYNNYDKAYFKATCSRLSKLDPPLVPLSKEDRARLKKQIQETPRESISRIRLDTMDLEQLRRKIETLLQKTVLSQVINELSANPALAEWVREGIKHHIGEEHSDECKFCDSTIPNGRIEKLQAHFNDEYNRFLIEIDSISDEIVKSQSDVHELQLPTKAMFYDHLSSEFVTASTALTNFARRLETYLNKLSDALAAKRRKPFESIVLQSFIDVTAIPGSESEFVAALNAVIDRHNAETENFGNLIVGARKRLEEAMVLEALPAFTEKTSAIGNIEAEIGELSANIRELTKSIQTLEAEIVEHVRPADELSEELRSYLGRDELKFEAVGNAYQITRNGIVAHNLSEGERTAIALLYFLKSLQDKAFSIANDIVVIDDPVSSLDANSLFCAFGYIKERTKDVGQLFILTHNFPLFRQVKNWFNHLPHQRKEDVTKRPARFYMVEAVVQSGRRNASLKQLDRLLHEFESEYHYLFKKVCDEANGDEAKRPLEEFYPMPNIARRILESFLSFRYPTFAGQLEKQMEVVTFDPAKKARILRFLHTYSHDGKISEPEHDLSVLAETPEVLKDLLQVIKAEDPKHYDEMIKLVSPPAAA